MDFQLADTRFQQVNLGARGGGREGGAEVLPVASLNSHRDKLQSWTSGS